MPVGFHHFEILDQDVIDPSNLNRQQYFTDEIGQVKVEVLRKRLESTLFCTYNLQVEFPVFLLYDKNLNEN